MNATLDEAQLTAALAAIPNWGVEHGELVRTVTFVDFNRAMKFVSQVAAFAEAANHHPDIDIRYNRVRLALKTHDADGRITQKDIDLASSIETELPK